MVVLTFHDGALGGPEVVMVLEGEGRDTGSGMDVRGLGASSEDLEFCQVRGESLLHDQSIAEGVSQADIQGRWSRGDPSVICAKLCNRKLRGMKSFAIKIWQLGTDHVMRRSWGMEGGHVCLSSTFFMVTM